MSYTHNLRDDIYACYFLFLWLGCVSGLRCDRSNDIIQQTISEAIAVIKPPITSRGYNVTLVPVFDKFGGLKETRIGTINITFLVVFVLILDQNVPKITQTRDTV